MSFWAAAGSVLGGLLGKSKTTTAGQNRYSDIRGLMKAAKEYGFNPLTLLSQGQAIGPSSVDNSAFGAGIANAFALAGDAVSAKRAQAKKLNDYQNQNKRLTEKVNAITLRSPVPGVYGTSKMPSDPEVYSDGTAESYVSGVSGLRGSGGAGPAGSPAGLPVLRGVSPADPRRPVDNKPVTTTSGVMVVDNPYLGEIYVPTLDGDEPMDLLDAPALIYGPPQISYQKGHFMTYGGGAESRPNLTREEAIRLRDQRELRTKKPKPKPKAFVRYGRPSYGGNWVQ